MKKSIRRRLLLSTSVILLFFAAMLVLMNSTLLEGYYAFMEKRMLKGQAVAVEEIVLATVDPVGLRDKLEPLERRHSITVSLIGSDGAPIYFTRMGLMDEPVDKQPGLRPAPVREPRMQPEVESREILPDGAVFELQVDDRLDVQYMTIKKVLADGRVLDVRVMLSSIKRGAAIARAFTIFAAGLGLLAAVLWAVHFSRRFTEPLVQMNSIAGSIAGLDFTRKCQVDGDDEMGQLAGSINELSVKLSVALDDLKAKNALLEEELEQERQLDKMRKEFVANVSHELRTPIAIIQGYAEGLRLNIAADVGKRLQYADVIVSETERMNKLVGDLLELSQYESGGIKLAVGDFDLAELARNTVEKHPNAKLDGLLAMDIPGHAPARADGRCIEQVLINFLNNALEHVSEQGRIVLSINESADGTSWVLSVVNDGNLIPEDCLLRIWDSFFRVDKARNRDNSRYGLGLSIVRAIQDMHGKCYGAENLEGKVRFWAEVEKAGQSLEAL